MRHPRRVGFSLPELCVVLGIIGVLIALILPAIQDARESARKLVCSGNLMQIGVAVHSSEATTGFVPGIVDASSTFIHQRSEVAQLAHFLIDSSALEPAIDEWRHRRGQSPAAPRVLHCPSDPQSFGSATSYRMNKGSEPPTASYGSGVFSYQMTWSEITDGLAHTAMFSERLVTRSPPPTPLHPTALLETIMDPDLHPADCVRMNVDGRGELALLVAGDPWVSASTIHSKYLHWLPPNTRWRDCANHQLGVALLAARSNHRQGVNTLACDGSVRFVPNTIDRDLWRALGTRCRGDRAMDWE